MTNECHLRDNDNLDLRHLSLSQQAGWLAGRLARWHPLCIPFRHIARRESVCTGTFADLVGGYATHANGEAIKGNIPEGI